ncbi:MAG: hypothetical protein NTW29_19900 [Bacteroidetes bacterium]|nr:hypothetical protein [Bacteroidota bacterium]
MKRFLPIKKRHISPNTDKSNLSNLKNLIPIILSIITLIITTFFNIQSLNRSNEQIKITQQERIIRILQDRPRLSIEDFSLGLPESGIRNDSLIINCFISNKGVREINNLRFRNYIIISDSNLTNFNLIESRVFTSNTSILPEKKTKCAITPRMVFANSKAYVLVLEFSYEDIIDPDITILNTDVLEKKIYADTFYYVTTGRFIKNTQLYDAETNEIEKINLFLKNYRTF